MFEAAVFMILTTTWTEKLLFAWAQPFQISSQLSEIKHCMRKMVQYMIQRETLFRLKSAANCKLGKIKAVIKYH